MMKNLLFIFSLFTALIFAQNDEYLIVLNEGYFDFTNQEIIEPVSIGVYDIQDQLYEQVVTIEGARFASDMIVDGDFLYVAADNKILKYEIGSFSLLSEVEVQGARNLLIHNDNLYVSRGDYDYDTYLPVIFDSYLHVYDKNNLTLITQFDSDNGPAWSTQNLVAKDGMVYVAINNGFEWNNEKGYIGVIDANNLTYINEFDLGENGSNPDNMVIKGDYILTVNNKNWSGSSVSRINLANNEVVTEDLADLSTGCGTSALRGDFLNYQVSQGSTVHKYDYESMETVDVEEGMSLNFYEIIESSNGLFYASSTDFFSYGEVYIFNQENEIVNSFSTGISPGTFAFYSNPIGCEDDDLFIEENFGNFSISDCYSLIDFLFNSYGYSTLESCSWDGSPMSDFGGLTIGDICECSCEGLEEETITVVDIIVGSEDHNTLETAVIAAGLVDALSGEGPFTVFAPTDDAFDALPEGTLDAVLADMDLLTSILTHHVAEGSVLSTDLANGMMVTTLNGTELMVTIDANGVMIDNAMVTIADVVADNGVVHVIDAVLIPETSSIYDEVSDKEIIMMVDLLGKRVVCPDFNVPYFIIYNDGSVSKSIILNK